MDKMVIAGGTALKGEVSVSGAKNSALKVIFASLLSEGKFRIKNIPHLNDVHSACELLRKLGSEASLEDNVLTLDIKRPPVLEAHYDVVRKMRASILVLGPLLAKYGEAVVSLPGGCAIGTRPIDQHLDGMRCLGAEVNLEQGYVRATAKNGLKGGNIVFDGVTVGGTENVLMASVLASGRSVIENAAKEPEIVDLANFLNAMGAKIKGAGTSVITVEGVAKLHPCEHEIIPDRIEAGTLLVAGAISKGDVTVKKCVPEHIESLIYKLKESGFTISQTSNSVTVQRASSWKGVDITTAPFPGYATDLQAQFMALMSVAEGTSIITETIFENRFMHVPELCRLNADITPKTRVAIIRGVPGKLKGAPVMATDLRASASLVLAGLAAEGETVVNRIYHLDRGYERLEEKLSSLGAKVRRID